jgi:ParB family chromosome partitioning protein
VANAVRLLNLPKPVQTLVLDGKLSAGHARALLASDDPEKLAEQVLARGLSVRDTEALVRRAAAGEPPARPAAPRAVKDTDTQALEVDLSETLGLAVEVLHRNGAGEVRISYENLEQLDEICRRLNSRL